GEIREIRGLVGAALDIAAKLAHLGGGAVALGVERAAAFAGAETVALGLGGRGIEADVLAQRQAAAAGRAAVDTGSQDAEEELAVEGAIVTFDGGPALVVVDHIDSMRPAGISELSAGCDSIAEVLLGRRARFGDRLFD